MAERINNMLDRSYYYRLKFMFIVLSLNIVCASISIATPAGDTETPETQLVMPKQPTSKDTANSTLPTSPLRSSNDLFNLFTGWLASEQNPANNVDLLELPQEVGQRNSSLYVNSALSIREEGHSSVYSYMDHRTLVTFIGSMTLIHGACGTVYADILRYLERPGSAGFSIIGAATIGALQGFYIVGKEIPKKHKNRKDPEGSEESESTNSSNKLVMIKISKIAFEQIWKVTKFIPEKASFYLDKIWKYQCACGATGALLSDTYQHFYDAIAPYLSETEKTENNETAITVISTESTEHSNNAISTDAYCYAAIGITSIIVGVCLGFRRAQQAYR
ncbi:hypothetical protein ACH42_04740 [Endozoicomonas sp. (ex Bugula neritina AB1)]|nr:hypothetical protein ACH42_04740 [Endozoicomonas sp. (ex Bugula neritina AB1)]